MLDVMENKNKMIVIEKNLEIVPKENFAQTLLKEGDSIEIISFVGGG
jgi:sulfur carrier protein